MRAELAGLSSYPVAAGMPSQDPRPGLALYMVAQCTKVLGSLLSNIKQATSQVVSREVSSRLSAFTSHSWDKQ